MGALIGALLAGGGAAGPAPDDTLLNPLASAETRERMLKGLGNLRGTVWLRVFTSASDDERLRVAALRLAQGLADGSDRVYAERCDRADGEAAFARFGIKRTPAMAVSGELDAGIRFYGVPGGHEVDSLVSAIRVVSLGDSGLSDASKQALAGLTEPVEIEVFVTLRCGYCPEAVQWAHRVAAASGLVTAAMVEVSAFPDYAAERGVSAVPKVFVNGVPCVEGRRSEAEFVAAVVECAASAAKP